MPQPRGILGAINISKINYPAETTSIYIVSVLIYSINGMVRSVDRQAWLKARSSPNFCRGDCNAPCQTSDVDRWSLSKWEQNVMLQEQSVDDKVWWTSENNISNHLWILRERRQVHQWYDVADDWLVVCNHKFYHRCARSPWSHLWLWRKRGEVLSVFSDLFLVTKRWEI